MHSRISGDDASLDSEELNVPIREAPEKEGGAKPKKEVDTKAKAVVEEEPLDVEPEDKDDDEEVAEDEYVVEKILDHFVDDETQELKFRIKWEGYEKKSDQTWEPEENLETASKILNEYLDSHGGKEAIMDAYNEKKKAAGESKSKKRGRSSTGTTTNGNPTKKGRKSHPLDGTPPAGAKDESFKPPSGSWEDQVVGIDACEGSEGNVVVYLTWKGNHKTQHPLAQVYKRCPQRMLKFYESHLVFKKNED